MIFHSPSKQMFWLGHERVLPYPFQFVIHQLTYYSMLYNLRYWQNHKMNSKKGHGKKSWPNLSYFPRICLQKLSKTTKNLTVRISGILAKVLIEHLLNKRSVTMWLILLSRIILCSFYHFKVNLTFTWCTLFSQTRLWKSSDGFITVTSIKRICLYQIPYDWVTVAHPWHLVWTKCCKQEAG
jgi:hypothetical protein